MLRQAAPGMANAGQSRITPPAPTPDPSSGVQPFGGNGVLPQPPVQPPPPPPGAPLGATTIDPNNNLQSVQVNPVASDRLKTQQGLVDENALKLAGVDRLKLAQDQFGTYANATDPAFQQSIRGATEAAASHGGLGSGMLTNQYGDLATTRARDLTNERDRLFQTAQEGSIADQFQKVGALQNLSGQTAAEEAAARGEVRGERGYQAGAAQNAEDSAVRRTQLEEALKSGDFERAMALAQYGDAGNPGGATLGVAGQQAGQNSADLQGLMELLKQYGYGQATKSKAA